MAVEKEPATAMAIIGHVSLDRNVIEEEVTTAPGGGVYFGSVAAARLGVPCVAVSKAVNGAHTRNVSRLQGHVAGRLPGPIMASYPSPQLLRLEPRRKTSVLASRHASAVLQRCVLIEGAHIAKLFFVASATQVMIVVAQPVGNN
eukprot:gene6646-6375_t